METAIDWVVSNWLAIFVIGWWIVSIVDEPDTCVDKLKWYVLDLEDRISDLENKQ